jgi:putative endonuclease
VKFLAERHKRVAAESYFATMPQKPSRRSKSAAESHTKKPCKRHARWFVYILECGDGTLYTGTTPDVAARLARHRAGMGARYTRGRGPLSLVYCEACRSRSDALRREYAVKRLGRKEKMALVRRGAVQEEGSARRKSRG